MFQGNVDTYQTYIENRTYDTMKNWIIRETKIIKAKEDEPKHNVTWDEIPWETLPVKDKE